MKKILLSTFLFCSLFATSSSEIHFPTSVLISIIGVYGVDGIEVSDEWTEYTILDGVKIEYKMTECGGKKMRAQNVLLFKFTNTTRQELTISWVTKEFRNDECWNCDRLDNPEYLNSMTLDPREVVEGEATEDYLKTFHIFGDFIKFVPGMTEQTLTNFELVDLTVR